MITAPPRGNTCTEPTHRNMTQGTQLSAEFNSSLVKTTRDHTHIDPAYMHPGWGIQPTGKYTVHVGLNGPAHPNPVNMYTAYIYAPAGKTMGPIPTARLQWLYQTYASIRDTHPGVHNML